MGTLTFSTHGSYENSAQLTEEQMDEIFSSDDPPVLTFILNGDPNVNFVTMTFYNQTTKRAVSELVVGGGGDLTVSRIIIGYYPDSSEGPLAVISNFSYFNGTSYEGALKAANQIELPQDPVQPLEAATKQYVDNLVGTINTTLDAINGEVV